MNVKKLNHKYQDKIWRQKLYRDKHGICCPW